MAVGIRDIFIDPPLAIARLGGSSMPQDAYLWVTAPEPRAGDTTTIAPTWSLAVQQDATVVPIMPTQVVLRDGPLIRPVAPFFEVWARVGKAGSRASSWRDVPLTPALLAQSGASLSDLVLQVDAKNLKAARRTGNPDLGFGTFPLIAIAADEYTAVSLEGSSPNGTREPLIPLGKNIPLGTVQILRSRPQPKDVEWAPFVNVEVIRFRYTPARGFVYGVPNAAKPSQPLPGANPPGPLRVAVDPQRAFLNPRAGWAGTAANDLIEPSDTYDGAGPQQRNRPSLGVVDDTCEVRFEAILNLPGRKQPLAAAAHAFVGPPDFAPDRRPFLSLADELNARGESRTRRKMNAAETDAWIQDLFERVFETVSLFNVDMYRELNALRLSESQRRRKPIPRDQSPGPLHAMGSFDRLRNADFPLPPRTLDEPLPLTEHARVRHRELADLNGLKDFIRNYPGRIETLVRRPFTVEAGESADVTSMRMPPFMRNSNALPLALSAWQYDLLMEWVDRQAGAKRELAANAKTRRKQVLARERRNARWSRP